MIQAVLNGVIVPAEEIDGDVGVSVTITVEDETTGKQERKATGEMRFTGDAFAAIEAALILPDDGRIRELSFKLYDDCMEPPFLLFEGAITGDLVNWCEGCKECTASAVEKSADSEAMNCLKSTLIYDDRNGFQSQAHPRMVYCDELRPDWLHHVLLVNAVSIMLLLIITYPVVVVVNAIVEALNWVIDAVNGLPGVNIDHIDFDGDEGTNTVQEYEAFVDRLQEQLVGCGRKHPSPLVRSYINNACAICGVTFQSSIFTDPASDYYNTVLFNAPVKKGVREDSGILITENLPNETVDTLLDKLGPVFWAQHRIINGVLRFERKDEFPVGGTWVDPMVLKEQGRLVGQLCYEFSKEELPSFLEIGFSEDAIDVVGNEARGLYKEIVEWNQPYNPVQKGKATTQFQFGMLRARRDGVGGDILDSYKVLWLTDIIDRYGDAMMLERGIAAFPKLLIWDGAAINDAKVRRFNVPGYEKTPAENYNYPYHLTEYGTTANTGYPSNAPGKALYARFHAMRNPKVISARGISFKFTFEYDASHLSTMNLYAGIPTPRGIGRISEVTINPNDRTILVTGKI